MPWNDTRSLDYCGPTPEAVIQTILAVARRFPIIRFDAARRSRIRSHRAALGYPGPGRAARSRHGESAMRRRRSTRDPRRFWREVWTASAAEVRTRPARRSLLAHGGYFVRTLGMHRVYNSAFMNMLRDEKKRSTLVVKNTLEFDPRSSSATSTS